MHQMKHFLASIVALLWFAPSAYAFDPTTEYIISDYERLCRVEGAICPLSVESYTTLAKVLAPHWFECQSTNTEFCIKVRDSSAILMRALEAAVQPPLRAPIDLSQSVKIYPRSSGPDLNRFAGNLKREANKAARDVGKLASSVVPKQAECLKAAVNPNWLWAIGFMNASRDELAAIGVHDERTCLAKRDAIAARAEKFAPGMGKRAVDFAGECLCDQVY